MRLIDADKIVEVAEHAWNEWNLAMATQDTSRGVNRVMKMQELCKCVKDVADDCPTIDPESLRPRGTWEGMADGYADGELVYDTWTCSECGYTVDTDDPDDLTKFCPNCGAKMEGGHNP